MTTLRIITIEYDGQRLEDIGNGVISAFEPLISHFNAIKRLGLRNLVLNFRVEQRDSIRLALQPLEGVLDYRDLPLLITQLPLLSPPDNHLYGISNGELKLAHVSTYKPDFGELDSEEHVERVVIEALHELGHCFGLRHHEGEVKTHAGKLCPMTTAQGADFIRGIITGAEYISLRDSFFCGDCYAKLGIPDPTLTLKF